MTANSAAFRIRVAIAASAIAAASAFPSSASVAPRTSFRTEGSCIEYAVGISVEAARAQASVPAGFDVLDVGGEALVAVFAQSCRTSVDDGPFQESVVAGIMVFLDPASAPAGCQVYDWFWQDSLDSSWVRANRELGWRMEIISSVLAETPTGFHADVPSALAPWTVDHTAVSGGVGAEVPLATVHCTLGHRGIVRGTYDHRMLEVGAGAGPVTLGSGPQWDALGAHSADAGPGAVFRFTWTGVTELLDPDAPQPGSNDSSVLAASGTDAARVAAAGIWGLVSGGLLRRAARGMGSRTSPVSKDRGTGFRRSSGKGGTHASAAMVRAHDADRD